MSRARDARRRSTDGRSPSKIDLIRFMSLASRSNRRNLQEKAKTRTPILGSIQIKHRNTMPFQESFCYHLGATVPTIAGSQRCLIQVKDFGFDQFGSRLT